MALATARLGGAGGSSAQNDARRIVEQASGLDGSDLVVSLDDPATGRAAAQVEAMTARRAGGEPLQYVLGSWGFRTLDLHVDPRVLIPRPETEVVAGVALEMLTSRAGAGGTGLLHAADLGTGSGAIALSLVAEREDVEVVATDVSEGALEVARANLAGLGSPSRRVTLVQGSWFEALARSGGRRFDLLVSNPPYVAAGEDLPEEVSIWEPREALIAGQNGTEALEHLVAGAVDWLLPAGALVLELAPHQAALVADSAASSGLTDVSVRRDQAGRERVLVARRPA